METTTALYDDKTLADVQIAIGETEGAGWSVRQIVAVPFDGRTVRGRPAGRLAVATAFLVVYERERT
jgi:hypothetical protein